MNGTLVALARKGYRLTAGVHSRIDSMTEVVADTLGAGNVYVNRNMIGAVVGVQPFGGSGLSGTGPKAGGPHYLPRFAGVTSRDPLIVKDAVFEQVECLDPAKLSAGAG
jgi:RHH-type proline utilization regulon transcriptional repressor/proline dehydrogenase/delta 1-pyrroline-5-carboxylate dehydrogenase